MSDSSNISISDTLIKSGAARIRYSYGFVLLLCSFVIAAGIFTLSWMFFGSAAGATVAGVTALFALFATVRSLFLRARLLGKLERFVSAAVFALYALALNIERKGPWRNEEEVALVFYFALLQVLCAAIVAAALFSILLRRENSNTTADLETGIRRGKSGG